MPATVASLWLTQGDRVSPASLPAPTALAQAATHKLSSVGSTGTSRRHAQLTDTGLCCKLPWPLHVGQLFSRGPLMPIRTSTPAFCSAVPAPPPAENTT